MPTKTLNPRGLLKRASLPGALGLLLSVGLTALLLMVHADEASAATFTVNSTGDASDVAPGNGVCETATPGECTLRAAIQEANAFAGTDTIAFNIPALTDPGCSPLTGVCTITPGSALPTITGAVTIDGYTQPGASPNTLSVGDNAQLKIELDGSGAAGDGLFITAGNSTVRGLVINRFAGNIHLRTNGGNVIEGNFVGTDVTGTFVPDVRRFSSEGVRTTESPNNIIGGTTPAARNVISGHRAGVLIALGFGVSPSGGNRVQGNLIGTDVTGNLPLGNGDGVFISGSSNNTIGGTTHGARNIISGNERSGVYLFFPTGTQVQGNFIGTDVTGTAPLGNGGVLGQVVLGAGGVVVQGSDNVIGGTMPEARNVISGNKSYGVQIVDGVTGNMVQGNFIGTDVTGTTPLGNSGDGVAISIRAPSNNTIGGTAAGTGNTIAFNGGAGVSIFPFSPDASCGTGDAILSNSIFSNTRLGIDLGPAGVTPNDLGDTDTGCNNLQNFPVLTSASGSGGGTTIQGTLNSTPNTVFRLEFFSNTVCDPSLHGEGETFLGFTNVTTDGGGNASFTAMVGAAPAGQQFITSTATDPNNNTSEFSPCAPCTSCPGAATPTPTPSPGKVTGGGQITGEPLFSALGHLLSDPAIITSSIGGTENANFGFVVNDGAAPSGNLEYIDHGAETVIKATSLTALFISDSCGTSTHARFTGFATVNGVPNQPFDVEVDDCSEPGTADTLGITTTGYTNGPKTLLGGNIQIHK